VVFLDASGTHITRVHIRDGSVSLHSGLTVGSPAADFPKDFGYPTPFSLSIVYDQYRIDAWNAGPGTHIESIYLTPVFDHFIPLSCYAGSHLIPVRTIAGIWWDTSKRLVDNKATLVITTTGHWSYANGHVRAIKPGVMPDGGFQSFGTIQGYCEHFVFTTLKDSPGTPIKYIGPWRATLETHNSLSFMPNHTSDAPQDRYVRVG
jgi:hypothetical protein